MDSKSVFDELTEKEQKLIQRMVNDGDDLQLIACNGLDSYLCVDGKKLDQCNVFIGYSGKEGKLSHGNYCGQNLSFANESGFLRVIIDTRVTENVKFHINVDGVYSKLSNDNENNTSLLLVYIEGPSFVQFSLFNGLLQDEKISHIFTTSTSMKPRIRSLAYSIYNQTFNEFLDYLCIIENDNRECEQEESTIDTETMKIL